MRIALPFSVLFPKEKALTLEEYLSGIGRQTLLKISPFFLGFGNDKSKYSNPYAFMEMFFSKGNEEIFRAVVENIEIFLRENNYDIQQVEIPYVISSLKFFEFVFDSIPEGTDNIDELESQVNIFKAYVLLNEIVTAEGGKIASESTADIPANLKPSALFVALQLHNFDLTNYRIDKLYSTQFLRAVMFFEFMESREDCKYLLNEFYNYYGVESYQHYLKLILPISVGVIMRDKESHTDIVIDKVKETGTGLLEKLTIDDTELLEAYDFKNLRSKPLLQISENTFRIISPQFGIELLYNGLYWKFKFLYDTLPKDKRPNKDLYHLKTFEFSEHFVLNKILKNYFGNRYFQKSGLELDEKFDNAPDYYVRNGNKIFLFESKDIMLSAEVKQSFDFNVIKAELEKKLFANEKGKPKAVLQIITNVRNILQEKLPFDKGFRASKVRVFPVLVLHYRMFNVGGLNKIVDSWFQEELIKVENEGLDTSRVNPLVIIDIDTLIFYEDIFSKRKLDFEECLQEYYHNYINFNRNGDRKFKDQETSLKAYQNSILPFETCLDIIADKKRLRAVPKNVLLKGYSLFDEN